VESLNKCSYERLTKYISDNGKDWDDEIEDGKLYFDKVDVV